MPVLVAIELMMAVELVTPPVGLTEKKVEQRLVLCLLASTLAE